MLFRRLIAGLMWPETQLSAGYPKTPQGERQKYRLWNHDQYRFLTAGNLPSLA